MVDNKINSSDNFSVSSSNYTLISSKLPCQIVHNAGYPINMGTSYYIPMITALIIIALITVVCNGAFLFVAYRSRRLRTVHNTFLVSLSITDFFTGVVVTPLNATSFILLMNGTYPCWVLWLSLISLDAAGIISFCTIALITLEKYLAIMHAFYYRRVVTKRKLIVLAFAVRIFGTSFSPLCHLIGLSYPNVRIIFLLCLNYSGVLFYLIIFYCYGRIFQAIQKVKRRITVENTVENDRTAIKENSNAAKTMVIVIGALTLCYLPSFIEYIWWSSSKQENIPKESEAVAKFIAIGTILLNSALNPIIYYARMLLVRKEFKVNFCSSRISA